MSKTQPATTILNAYEHITDVVPCAHDWMYHFIVNPKDLPPSTHLLEIGHVITKTA